MSCSPKCSKTFIQQVNASSVGTIIYWTLQADSAPDWFDASGHGLRMYNSAATFVPAKQGNGARMLGQIDPNTPALLAHGSGGFSMCCWLKINTLGILGYVLYEGDTSNCSLALKFSTLTSYLEAKDTNFVHQENVPVALSTGVWMFVHLFYDSTLGKMGVSFNGGAPTFASFTPVVTPSAAGQFIAAGVSCDIVVDEILVSPLALLTAAQITYLYNGGAGRTWPIILP